MPRGTASRWQRGYAVRLTVPRRGGWRAWGAERADFERALTDPADPAITSAEIASELRRGADYVRVTVALTVRTADVADALAIAWDAFRSAARDDLAGWEMAAAAAQVQPEPPLAGRLWSRRSRAGSGSRRFAATPRTPTSESGRSPPGSSRDG